jgi:hypothetical protein
MQAELLWQVGNSTRTPRLFSCPGLTECKVPFASYEAYQMVRAITLSAIRPFRSIQPGQVAISLQPKCHIFPHGLDFSLSIDFVPIS